MRTIKNIFGAAAVLGVSAGLGAAFGWATDLGAFGGAVGGVGLCAVASTGLALYRSYNFSRMEVVPKDNDGERFNP